MKAFNLNWTNAMEGGRLIDEKTPFYHFDADAVWTDHDGMTTLHIVTDPKDINHCDGKTYQTLYATGLMRSVETFGYGTYSAEIKLPKGRNLWPSFWLCGDGHWPDSGEIDVFEGYANTKGSYFRFPLSWATQTNIHYLADGKHAEIHPKNVSWLKQMKNPTENFIKYEVEWRPNAVIFRVNGKVVRTIGWDVTQYFEGKAMNVILSVKPASENFAMDTAMMIKNFKYEELS